MMSMPSLSAQPNRQPRVPKANPRFGEGAQSQPAATTASTSTPATTAQPTSTPESNKPELPAEETKPLNFFQKLSDRLVRFLKDLNKAFKHLFGKQKPKSELDVQLKDLKHNLKQFLNEDKLKQSLQDEAKNVEANPLTAEERELYEPLLTAAKTEEGRQQWVNDRVKKPFTEVLASVNQTIQDPAQQDEVRRFIWHAPAFQANLANQFQAALAEQFEQDAVPADSLKTEDTQASESKS